MGFIAKIFTKSIQSKTWLVKELKKISEIDKSKTNAELLGMNNEKMQSFIDCCTKGNATREGRLIWANYCRNDDVCIACASRRAYVITKDIVERMPEDRIERKNRYMLTLTMQHYKSRNLNALLKVLFRARDKLVKAANNGRNGGQKATFFSQFDGMIFSLEITYNKTNWRHPHFHVLACCDKDKEIGISTVKAKKGQHEKLYSTNEQGLAEREKYIEKSYQEYIEDALLVVDKAFEPFIDWKANAKAHKDEKKIMMSEIDKISTYRWLHIKKIDNTSIAESTFGRKSIWEVFKYTLKMNSDDTKDNLSPEYVVKAAIALSMIKTRKLVKTWCFRLLDKKSKIRNFDKYTDFIEYTYEPETQSYKKSSKNLISL